MGSANQSQAGLKMPGEFSDSRTAGIGREYKGAPPMFKQAHAKTKRSRNDLETIIAALPATPLDNGRNPSSRAIPCGLRMEFRGSARARWWPGSAVGGDGLWRTAYGIHSCRGAGFGRPGEWPFASEVSGFAAVGALTAADISARSL